MVNDLEGLYPGLYCRPLNAMETPIEHPNISYLFHVAARCLTVPEYEEDTPNLGLSETFEWIYFPSEPTIPAHNKCGNIRRNHSIIIFMKRVSLDRLRPREHFMNKHNLSASSCPANYLHLLFFFPQYSVLNSSY